MMTRISRRDFLKLSAGTGLGLTLSACGILPINRTGRPIKIGYVSPQSGPLAGFGEADEFTLKQVRAALAEGILVAGTTHPVEIIVADSQSDPGRASEVAADLIFQDEIDLMVVASTPETTNPVCDQCEVNQVPCISTITPWQPWYFRTPEISVAGYRWTYHFFWGLEDIIQVFLSLWESLDTNKVVGGMWPNDGDGLAWSDPDLGFPPAIIARGYKVVDPGRYENLTPDFTPQITIFKEAGVEIVTGVMIPPDLATFLAQADQQGFKPKAVTVGKAALFPVSVEAISNNLGDGLTSEIWWGPTHPFTSSLTGDSSSDLTRAYQLESGKQWTQPLGFIHALFEVAADTLARTTDIEDKAEIVAALKATKLNTMVGLVSWEGGPTPNVSKTPLVGGQWGPGQEFPWELTIVSNVTAPIIPVGGSIQLMPGS
jgi:branched-chain amino acid transport system substrate-binding protein